MTRHCIMDRRQALRVIRASTTPLGSINVPLEDAYHRIAAEDIRAGESLPGCDRSLRDGYAVAGRDTASATHDHPVTLSVVTTIRSSVPWSSPIRRGQAARIMTGGMIPQGADTVLPDEETTCLGKQIRITAPANAGRYIARKGRNIKKGTLIVAAGEWLTPAIIGTLASLRIGEVPVVPPPRVSVLAVGSELADPKDPSTSDKLMPSNLYMVSALITECGGVTHSLDISKNDRESIRRKVAQARKADLLITTGGSAKSPTDLTRSVLEESGVDLRVRGVSMRPGKTAAFGVCDDKPVFILPGTPTAVFTAFYALVRPALYHLMGGPSLGLNSVSALLDGDIAKKTGVEHWIQGRVHRVNGRFHVAPLLGPDIDTFTAMNRANGLIVLDAEETPVSAGQTVRVRLLPAAQDLSAGKGLPPPLLSIVGKSDAGKTTLLEQLVTTLVTKGYTVGTIKHDVHGFDIDHKGKDSWRHKAAGASTVAISSPKKVAVVRDVTTEETLEDLIDRYFLDMDLVLAEGYKKQPWPKIEVFRSGVHKTPLCTNDATLVAFVSDTPLRPDVPCFALEDIDGIADLVEKTFLT